MLGHTSLGREVLLFNISLDFLQKCNTKYNFTKIQHTSQNVAD